MMGNGGRKCDDAFSDCSERPRVCNYLLTDKDYCPRHVPRMVGWSEWDMNSVFVLDAEVSRLNALEALDMKEPEKWEDPIL